MTTPLTVLTELRRPRLLVRAARIGLGDYDRRATLRRLLPIGHDGCQWDVFEHLAEVEARLDSMRVEGEATYSVARHVEVLIALVAEARLIEAARPQSAAA